MRKLLTAGLFGLGALFISAPAAIAADEIYTGRFSNEAVQGHDVVAYFTEGAPTKGKDEFTTEYEGATWLFSSQENLDAFEDNPEKYAPAYGGYCAWAVAEGKLAPGKAKYWTIIDDVLYLNFSRGVQKKWLADTEGFIERADEQWPDILN